MQDSIFTKIIKGEIPCHKIYEDEHTIAFLDIHPSMPGHTLVVPKKQVAYLWDADEEVYAYLMAAVKTVGDHMRATLPQEHVGVKVVGVDVPHAHVHLVPFDTVEEYEQRGNMTTEPDHEALANIAQTLSMIEG